MVTTRKQIFQMPGPRRITKVEMEMAIAAVMTNSRVGRDRAVLSLYRAMRFLAEGRK